jgi:hypothetical protein
MSHSRKTRKGFRAPKESVRLVSWRLILHGGAVMKATYTGIPRGLVSIDDILRYLHQDRYISKTEAADYLSLSPRTLDARQDIPRFKLGSKSGTRGKVLFKKSELDQWMQTNRVSAGEELDLLRIADEALRAVLRKRSSVGKKRRNAIKT